MYAESFININSQLNNSLKIEKVLQYLSDTIHLTPPETIVVNEFLVIRTDKVILKKPRAISIYCTEFHLDFLSSIQELCNSLHQSYSSLAIDLPTPPVLVIDSKKLP